MSLLFQGLRRLLRIIFKKKEKKRQDCLIVLISFLFSSLIVEKRPLRAKNTFGFPTDNAHIANVKWLLV